MNENNCKLQLVVVVGPVLLPTPGQGEMRDEEFSGKLGEIRVNLSPAGAGGALAWQLTV